MIHDDEDLLEYPFVRGLTLEHSREFNPNEYSLEPVVWNRRNARRIRYESLKRQDVLDTMSKNEAFSFSFFPFLLFCYSVISSCTISLIANKMDSNRSLNS